MVPKLVEAEMDTYIPRKLRDQVDKQRSELISVQVEICNSLSILCIDGTTLGHGSSANDLSREAKRANSFIKIKKHFGEDLHPILDNKGRASDIFPKTVNELLGFNGQSSPPFPVFRLSA